jgi:hypothetical protein
VQKKLQQKKTAVQGSDPGSYLFASVLFESSGDDRVIISFLAAPLASFEGLPLGLGLHAATPSSASRTFFWKGAMWHEARRSERKVHDLMDAARRRAQRRAAYLARRRGDTQQALQVSGTRCRVHRDDTLYQATEDQQGLCVPASLYLSICFDATLGCSES